MLALLIAILPAVSGGAELGRLFFSAQEREHLDQLRRGEPASPHEPRMGSHVITGYVERSDGRGTVWIDGRAIPIKGASAERLLKPDGVRDYSRATPGVKARRAH